MKANKRLRKFLDKNIEENSTLLDIGCGPKLYSDPFINKCKKIVTIDAWEKVNPTIVADLEKENIINLINEEKFDYILMLDFIEHLDKTHGKRLIENCKKIVNKKIFLLTPLEEIWTTNHEHVENEKLWCYGNSFDLHKSIWNKNDFVDWQEISIPGFENYYFGYYTDGR